MITLRLFRVADPFQQIDCRALSSGDLVIGRDRAADWVIEDPKSEISRRHLSVSCSAAKVQVCDTSANGVFTGAGRRRLTRECATDVALGESIYFGEYMILVDGEASEEAGPASPVTHHPSKSRGDAFTDAALLEAFCAGAGLEASSFAGEDLPALMQRLGVVYRQVVEDLCGLMRDRASLKDSLQLERTTIRAQDNNPLKWAPPHRLAVDLLREGASDFLVGADAIEASFGDLRRHGQCLLAASRASVRGVLAELEPAGFENESKKQSLPFVRAEQAWRAFRDRHALLVADLNSPSPGKIDRAFRAGYETHLQGLEDEEAAA